MNPAESYRQFCPVAMAAEVFCTRWTPLIVRELVSGSTRFNDLRRGMPRISPTLLSKRLKQLEEAGVIRRQPLPGEDIAEYRLTPAGEELKGVVFDLGFWGQRWIEAQSSLKNLDPSLLMWDMRRNLDPTPIPPDRRVIQIVYPELKPGKRSWWLVVQAGETDLCSIDPGFEVDLHIVTDLRTMTAIWMGLTTVKAEEEEGSLHAIGDETLKNAMQQWLGLSPFAAEKKRVSA